MPVFFCLHSNDFLGGIHLPYGANLVTPGLTKCFLRVEVRAYE